MLTQLSSFWFEKLGHIVGNHLISTDPAEYPEPLPTSNMVSPADMDR
ncbi:hypothetical protein MUP00_03275 [Candidatus Bathyarchaeota archaeon]|nr:hypothetical protein [Candidatus Bathyarchaeota archaeon]